MKIILQKTVTSLGDEGEIRTVRSGYARNYLFPRKLAKAYSEDSINIIRHQKMMMARKAKKRSSTNHNLAENLKDLKEVLIEANVATSGKLYGSVSTYQISQKLKEQGITIHRSKIDVMGARIRTPGDYTVRIKLLPKLVVSIPVKIVPSEEKKQTRKERKPRIRSIQNPKSLENIQPENQEGSPATQPDMLHSDTDSFKETTDNDSGTIKTAFSHKEEEGTAKP